ncbi:hypothetical protein HK101_010297 [Irineochytrium annulatum]|nr:hypothetical protein HK101_010297 [Irineochytrium annulatum]
MADVGISDHLLALAEFEVTGLIWAPGATLPDQIRVIPDMKKITDDLEQRYSDRIAARLVRALSRCEATIRELQTGNEEDADYAQDILDDFAQRVQTVLWESAMSILPKRKIGRNQRGDQVRSLMIRTRRWLGGIARFRNDCTSLESVMTVYVALIAHWDGCAEDIKGELGGEYDMLAVGIPALALPDARDRFFADVRRLMLVYKKHVDVESKRVKAEAIASALQSRAEVFTSGRVTNVLDNILDRGKERIQIDRVKMSNGNISYDAHSTREVTRATYLQWMTPREPREFAPTSVFHNIMRPRGDIDPTIWNHICDVPTEQEVDEALKKLGTAKAGGPSGLTKELWCIAGPTAKAAIMFMYKGPLRWLQFWDPLMVALQEHSVGVTFQVRVVQELRPGAMVTEQLSERVAALAFVDDTAVMAEMEEDLRRQMDLILEYETVCGMESQPVKMKFLLINGPEDSPERLKWHGVQWVPRLEREDSERYLGNYFEESASGKGTKRHIRAAVERVMCALSPKAVTDKMAVYIINRVLIPQIQYLWKSQPVDGMFLEEMDVKLRGLVRHKAKLATSTANAILYHPEIYGLECLRDLYFTERTVMLMKLLNTDGICGRVWAIRLRQLQQWMAAVDNPLRVPYRVQETRRTSYNPWLVQMMSLMADKGVSFQERTADRNKHRIHIDMDWSWEQMLTPRDLRATWDLRSKWQLYALDQMVDATGRAVYTFDEFVYATKRRFPALRYQIATDSEARKYAVLLSKVAQRRRGASTARRRLKDEIWPIDGRKWNNGWDEAEAALDQGGQVEPPRAEWDRWADIGLHWEGHPNESAVFRAVVERR